MGKYVNIESDIFSVFALPAWTATSIKAYPANFVAVNPGTEYIRANILTGGRGVNLKSATGQMIIDIFTPAGNGTRRSLLIADSLDDFFCGKSLSTQLGNVTQFFSSTVQHRGIDNDNKSLFRTSYTIPFNYYGK